MWMKPWIVCAFLILVFETPILLAQEKQDKKELADEYFKRENFAKALEIYESLLGPPEVDAAVFPNLMKCLEKVKPGKVEATLKKFLKKYPEQYNFQVYQYHYIKEKQSPKDLDKHVLGKWIPWMLRSEERVYQGFSFFTGQKEGNYRQVLLELAVKNYGFEPFWKLVLESHLEQKNYQEAAKVVSELVNRNQPSTDEVKAYLQEEIQNADFSKQLQTDLLKLAQQRPNQSQYPEFLAWIYLQTKDYEGALAQYKALDLQQNTGGTRTFQLAEFAINNDQQKIAIKCFEFLIQQFPTSPYRYMAQQKLIQLKEEEVKNTYPVQKQAVRNLIAEYQSLAQNQYLNMYELTIKVAELYGKFLNSPDSAISLLEGKMKATRWPKNQESKAKILLADMYILKNEPWEASLLYGQVEKDEAESPVGYEAKLKNAKVFYFKGEFELCQEQLDVLKMSTTRDISNDAIDLGLLIQDILAEDTTGYFLGRFAEIDLLTFQGNFPGAIQELEKILAASSNTVVVERMRFRLFKNYMAIRSFDLALEQLDLIFKTKSSDLFLDDALFFSAEIYGQQKKDKDKAMDLYLQLIKEFPGSVFVVEARKKWRLLRGDAVN